MKGNVVFSGMVLCYTICLLPGCVKVYDYINLHSNDETKKCSISSIEMLGPYLEDSIVISYNAFGDPVSAIRENVGTGNPNLLFRYDSKHRLTDYAGIYSDGTSVEFWHKYFYDNSGRIISDSNFIFLTIDNGQPATWSAHAISTSTFLYDTKNRIIEETTNFAGATGPPIISSYEYNVQGNLAGYAYDQKTNFHRTNSVWMFIDRDYSVNNQFVADTYNSFFLPTKVRLDPNSALPVFLRHSFFNADIYYRCK